MTLNRIKVLWLTALLSSGFSACAPPTSVEILIKNPSSFERHDEAVLISRKDLDQSLPGGIPLHLFPVVLSASGDTIPSQADDMTAKGYWDELFFMINIEAGGSTRLKVVFAEPDEIPDFKDRTNIRMARITNDGQYIEVSEAPRLTAGEGIAAGVYHLEGPGWENDLVGFRNYLDVRNGMDVFGKITSGMVLDRAGIGEDYHFKQDWGQDILRVGTSLGAGSLAIEKNGKIYRLAPGAEASFEKVTEGPLRSVLRLHFDKWTVEDDTISLVHEISILAGKWYYESRVFAPDLEEEVSLIAGITSIDLDKKKAVVRHFDDQWTAIMTHGPQAYDGEMLGLGIMLQATCFQGYEHTQADADDITDSFLIRMPLSRERHAAFRFYAAWKVSDKRFATQEHFEQLLLEDAGNMSYPLVVSLK